MAVASTDFTLVKRTPLGTRYLVTGKYKPSGTYTSGGESLTKAIVRQALGISQIDAMGFGGLMSADFTTFSNLVFDGARTASIEGKIHIVNQVPAHTHDMLAIGGLTSSETLFLDASQSFGKNAATNRTIVGSTSATTGGVRPNAVTNVGGEVAAGSDYSAGQHYSWFWAIGR